MRKFLLSTSAIVGVGLIAAPAGAAERIKLSLGGYMEQWIGFANVEDDAARNFVNFDQQSDSEIYFAGTTTLDNGIKIAARFDMEGERANAGNIDESWIQISSDSLGLVALGEDDTAANFIKYGMPDVGIGDGDAPNWVPGLGNVRFSNNIGRDDDEHKISYFTPTTIQKATGLQVVASWIPEVSNFGDTLPNATADTQSGYGLGVTFKSGAMGLDLGGFDVSLAYGMLHEADGQRTAGGNSSTGHQGSAAIKYNEFTLGGAYTRRMSDGADQGTPLTNGDDGYSWEAGLSYAQGPYSVSVGYSEYSTSGHVNNATINTQDDDQGSLWMVSGAWKLSDGVAVKASIFDVDYDDEGDPVDANETDGGWGIVAGMKLDF